MILLSETQVTEQPDPRAAHLKDHSIERLRALVDQYAELALSGRRMSLSMAAIGDWESAGAVAAAELARRLAMNAPTRYLLVPDEAHHLFALRPGGVVEHFDLCHGKWHPAPAEVLKDIAETFGDMTEVAYSDLPAVAQ